MAARVVRTRRKRTRNPLARIEAIGFKSFYKRQGIELKPLTLLAGPNSAGKSSLMQCLLLLKQTLEAPFDPGALLLDGPNVSLTSADQILAKRKSQDTQVSKFTLGLTVGESTVDITYRRQAPVGFGIESVRVQDAQSEKEYTLREGMPHSEVRKNLPAALSDVDEMAIRRKLQWTVVRSRSFLSWELRETEGRESFFGGTIGSIGFTSTDIEEVLQDIIHVPGLRGNPERTYKTTAVGRSFPGTFETYTASVILDWQSKDQEKLTVLKRQLSDLHLTWKVEAKQVDDTRVELKVGRMPHAEQGGAHDLVSIADVGFGVSQTLPVLVALLAAKPGQLVYLEQPEIHLHPRAQLALGPVIAEAVARDVLVVVETHSSLLLRSLQTEVALKRLGHQEVALHWFSRDVESGATVISTADVQRDGSFGDWPEDFDDVSFQADVAYLDAAERVE